MKRPGIAGAVAHDLQHRGVSAWALSSVLLGFYFGLYLPGETKQLLTWLGFARPEQPVARLSDIASDARVHLTFPGLGAWALTAAIAALVALPWAWFAARDEGFAWSDAVKRGALTLAAKTAGLTLATMALSLFFANALERPEHGGRHLLPVAGERWPAFVLAPLLALSVAGVLYGLARAAQRKGDTGALLRALALPLASLFAGALVVLYGTHWLEPAGVPDHERSARGFFALLYGKLDSKWTLYGLLYTMSVTVGGVWMIGRYLHNRYQVVRTIVVVFVQSTFAFSVPALLELFQRPGAYLSYFWPLKIDSFYPDNVLRQPMPFILWSFVGALVLAPLLGVFFGKRWYCSWVCGCGGLANTAGEPFRHLSQKGTSAWRFERGTIYTVLVVAVVVTLLVVLSAFVGEGSSVTGAWWPGHGDPSTWRFEPTVSGGVVRGAARVRYVYGVLVVAVLSGAVGVGLYPLGGTRVWCRYFCPMAAMLGLVQKFGRFRIKVKPDMCISCGMCTQYCEMGIDVRAYAQSNESFTRASCVGCGMCAEVCPRGVLQLEQRFPKEPGPRPALVQLRVRK